MRIQSFFIHDRPALLLRLAMTRTVFAAVAVAVLQGGQAMAQTASPISNTELSKESENPVTRVITLPLRYEAEFDNGAYKATKDTFEIDQAIVPLRLNADWTLIARTKLPAEALPPKKFGDSWSSGLSNGYTTFFLSPENRYRSGRYRIDIELPMNQIL